MPITPTNIKLICSDIDGTLLQYGKKDAGSGNPLPNQSPLRPGHPVLPGVWAAVHQPAQTV